MKTINAETRRRRDQGTRAARRCSGCHPYPSNGKKMSLISSNFLRRNSATTASTPPKNSRSNSPVPALRLCVSALPFSSTATHLRRLLGLQFPFWLRPRGHTVSLRFNGFPSKFSSPPDDDTRRFVAGQDRQDISGGQLGHLRPRLPGRRSDVGQKNGI